MSVPVAISHVCLTTDLPDKHVITLQNAPLILKPAVLQAEGGWFVVVDTGWINRATAMVAGKTILSGRYRHISERDSD